MHCAICLEQVRSSLIFKTTKRCNHSFCRDCISRYIIASTDSGVVNVRCPGFYCDAMLDPVYCRQLVSGERFLRWCDLLCESSVLGFARCYCPNLNCRELIISGRGGGNGNVGRFKCPRCGQSGCFLCARPWVEGHRCNDRDAANIHLLERLAERKQWKRCPNCNIYVERLGGCGTISCRCGTRFCYGCGRKSGLSCVCREDRGRRIVAEVLVWLHCALVLLGVLAVILQPLLGYSL